MAYESKVKESSRELTLMEKINLDDTSDMSAINDYDDGYIFEGIKWWAIVEIHNDRLQDKTDYTLFVISDKDGEQYYTSSESFTEAFMHIWKLALEEHNRKELPEEDFSISLKLKRIQSKNYKGKEILSCKYIA